MIAEKITWKTVRLDYPEPVIELQVQADDGPPPPPSSGTRSLRAGDVQAAKFIGSVVRLPFKALANTDRLYEDYVRPFVKAMLFGRAARAEAARRLAICGGCPMRTVAERDWFAAFQVGIGIMVWGVILSWWWFGPFLFLAGILWAARGASTRWGDDTKASFCKQCNCGTHGMARLESKVKRRGATCPAKRWENSNG